MRKTNFRWPRAPLSSRPLSPRPPLQGQAAAPKGPAFLFLLNYRRRFPLPSYSTSIPFSRSSRSTSMKPDGARRWHVGKPLLVAFQWTIFEIHRASLRSIANCVKLAYLGGWKWKPSQSDKAPNRRRPKGHRWRQISPGKTQRGVVAMYEPPEPPESGSL